MLKRKIIAESIKSFLAENLLMETYGWQIPPYELNEIGLVRFECMFDEDDYSEWLSDNELTDSQDVRLEYYKTEVTYDFELFDSVYFHHLDFWENVLLDDAENYFGEKGAEIVLTQCMKNGEGSFETVDLYEDEAVDINNPHELDDIAMRMIPNGDYFKGCRGFILHNGVVVYMPNEHNECSIINGVEGTYHFIALGNVRLLPNSIDIGQKPTPQQEEVIEQVASEYEGEEFFMDLDGGKRGQCGVRYAAANPERIMADIEKYYDEGLKPSGDSW